MQHSKSLPLAQRLEKVETQVTELTSVAESLAQTQEQLRLNSAQIGEQLGAINAKLDALSKSTSMIVKGLMVIDTIPKIHTTLANLDKRVSTLGGDIKIPDFSKFEKLEKLEDIDIEEKLKLLENLKILEQVEPMFKKFSSLADRFDEDKKNAEEFLGNFQQKISTEIMPGIKNMLNQAYTDELIDDHQPIFTSFLTVGGEISSDEEEMPKLIEVTETTSLI